jgi:hypothetical protein
MGPRYPRRRSHARPRAAAVELQPPQRDLEVIRISPGDGPLVGAARVFRRERLLESETVFDPLAARVEEPAARYRERRGQLARSIPTSGRAGGAKASAIRTIERPQRERRKQPVPPMPDGWYPHEPADQFYRLDWVFLHEHPHTLERHSEAAWREGRAWTGG